MGDQGVYRERKSWFWVVLIALGIVFAMDLSYHFAEEHWLTVLGFSPVHILRLFMGILSSMVLIGAVVWHLVNHRVPVFPPDVTRGNVDYTIGQIDGQMRLRQHAFWFINLRWVATAVALWLIILSSHGLPLLTEETFLPLLSLTSVLTLTNLFFTSWARRTDRPYVCIVVQVVSDLVILTGLLHFSGGLENPLFIIYSFHVIISGILLSKRTTYALAGLACGLLGTLAAVEYFHVAKHYTIHIFPHEMAHAISSPYYVLGEFFPFAGVLLCVAYFTTMVVEYLRKNEGRLEEMARVALGERRKLETAVNAVGAGMLLLDRGLQVVWSNSRFQEWFECGRECLGQRCDLAGCGDDARRTCEECISAKALEKGTMQEAERNIISPKWGKRFYHVIASPIRDEKGEIIQVAELIQDITARKAMEFEMLQSSKMALLGRMAAGIAHEVGNPLSSLSTRIQLMESRKDEGFMRDSLHVLQEQIGRIRRITQGIAQLARPQKEDSRPCRINEILEEAVEVLRLDRRAKGVTVTMCLSESNPTTIGSKDKFLQIFINMGLNAVEAMKGSGTLRISSTQRDGTILVTFKDTGPGLSEEARANLFSPFYTTKEHGLGLGLFICYSIVNTYGGEIEVETGEGKGASFIIKLPVRQEKLIVVPAGVSG